LIIPTDQVCVRDSGGADAADYVAPQGWRFVEQIEMKTLITAAVLAAVVASPAFARTRVHAHVAPAMPQMSAPDQVYQGNQYIGADPDNRIRLEMQRDTAINGAA
jgi:hypothetical protein